MLVGQALFEWKRQRVDYLHGATFNTETIEFLGSRRSMAGISESDLGGATAGAVPIVVQLDSGNGTCGFGEVIL